MFETSRLAVTPEDTVTEFNRLYLEKCKEVNRLEELLEEATKQLEETMKQLDGCHETIRELAAEPIKGVFPNIVPPEELPKCLLEETVTTHDILCLSSALKNLFEIHKCDSFALYIKLSRVLEKKIEEYCKEEG